MPDVFLSYNREDQVTARRFAEALEREGFSVWWMSTLRSGEAYDQVTERALKEAKAVAVLWSRHSVESRWVRAEATIASRNQTLAPVMIEACDRPIMFELIQTADLAHWTGDANDPTWRSYVSDLQRLVQQTEHRIQDKPEHRAAAPLLAAGSRRIAAGQIAIIALLVLIAVGLIARYALAPDTLTEAPAVAATPATTATASTPKPSAPAASIAVVPFANLTGEPAKEYFSDGMAEELINALAKVPGLNVASRISSFAYKGKNTDIRQIARDLDVSTVLEGSVRSAGDRIRVTAQLINAESGYHLWSQTYDREFKDLFKLEDELASEIVDAFKKTVNADLPAFESEAPPTRDLEAYALYLRGLSAMDGGTDAAFREVLNMGTQAIARDPNFGRAYWLTAAARSLLQFPLADVERDARHALALDPANPSSAQSVLGSVAARRGDWVAAEQLFRAIPASSKNPEYHQLHALSTLWPLGQLRKAQIEIAEAHRLAPAVAGFAANLARINSNLGLDAEAIRYVNLAISLGADPAGRRIAQIHVDAAARAGRYSEAAERMIATFPDRVRTANGGAEAVTLFYDALADRARRPAAVAALQALIPRLAPEDWVVKAYAMLWYVQLGALDESYALGDQLRTQLARQTVQAAWSWLWSPEMRAFRQDARFQAFATQLGLMDYWKVYGPPDLCDLKGSKLSCR